MEKYVYFIHREAVECEKHVFATHEVSEQIKSQKLLSAVEQEKACDVAHSLNVAEIWPEQCIGQKHIFQWLVKFISESEKLKLAKGSVEIFFDYFCVFPENCILFNVILAKFGPIYEYFVQFVCYFHLIWQNQWPHNCSNFLRDALMKSGFEDFLLTGRKILGGSISTYHAKSHSLLSKLLL